MELIVKLRNALDYPEKMNKTRQEFEAELERVIRRRLELRADKDKVWIEFL